MLYFCILKKALWPSGLSNDCMQEIRSSNPVVVTGICDPNNS